ncbi:MAG: DUF1840 domain-containing protein [Pseudorhodobacter sp.]|nr:DUF1840 domain-containing protein [Rhizobacter sp.]
MIYKFKSKAAGDVIMMGPNGDQVLRLMGRQPSSTGIIEVAHMPAALALLEEAVASEDVARLRAEQKADDLRTSGSSSESRPNSQGDPVSIRQRVWPLVEMMRRSHSQGADIVWGV